ncbi:MAG: hypothetical protein H7263_18840 [Candidatus Sericytochromatia bacterium]|nr:hypothetical protein [Candidatus Sericytochromatia bacterium]
MNKNFSNEVIEGNNTDKLNNKIFLISIVFTVVVLIVTLLTGKFVIAKSLLLGIIGSLLYLRMQVMFVNSFSKRNLISIFISVLSSGRILIVFGVLLVAITRSDLFNFYAVILGMISIHLISVSVFTYNIFLNFKNSEKKLIAN